MMLANILVFIFGFYFIIGFAFACWFVVKGVNSLDEGMVHANWRLRLLILPGSVLLWFVLLGKVLRSKRLISKI